MPRALMVSVVEDDPFFRGSMGRLMRSLGYSVELFSSAADFLASPRRVETSCLICDVQMPVMSGLDLHRSLVEAGNAIPTILVTAYPNDADRARCARRSDLKRVHELSPTLGKVNRNTAPRGFFVSAQSRPPWARTMDRQIDSPIPTPLDFVL